MERGICSTFLLRPGLFCSNEWHSFGCYCYFERLSILVKLFLPSATPRSDPWKQGFRHFHSQNRNDTSRHHFPWSTGFACIGSSILRRIETITACVRLTPYINRRFATIIRTVMAHSSNCSWLTERIRLCCTGNGHSLFFF